MFIGFSMFMVKKIKINAKKLPTYIKPDVYLCYINATITKKHFNTNKKI